MNVFDINELRRRGLADETIFPEIDLKLAEQRVWDFIETFCGQFFEARIFSDSLSNSDYPAMKLDGNNRNLLPLPVPIIELYSLKEEDEGEILLTDVNVYNRFYPDDRRRPRIQYKDLTQKFLEGNQNYILEGKFGFVERDGSTPSDLIEAAIKILLLELTPIVGKPKFKVPGKGVITQEIADKYMYRLAAPTLSGGVTGIPEVDKILFKYRRGDDTVFGGVI